MIYTIIEDSKISDIRYDDQMPLTNWPVDKNWQCYFERSRSARPGSQIPSLINTSICIFWLQSWILMSMFDPDSKKCQDVFLSHLVQNLPTSAVGHPSYDITQIFVNEDCMQFDHKVGNTERGGKRSERIKVWISRTVNVIEIWSWLEHSPFASAI